MIYDGECSVCRGAVDWIRARSETGAFEFLSCHADDLPRRFPGIEKNACLAAVHLILSDGAVLAGEKAAPEVFARIPGYGWIARALRLPGAGLFSGAFYRWFARRRHAISSLFLSRHGDA